jgi:hypothetical protein
MRCGTLRDYPQVVTTTGGLIRQLRHLPKHRKMAVEIRSRIGLMRGARPNLDLHPIAVEHLAAATHEGRQDRNPQP